METSTQRGRSDLEIAIAGDLIEPILRHTDPLAGTDALQLYRRARDARVEAGSNMMQGYRELPNRVSRHLHIIASAATTRADRLSAESRYMTRISLLGALYASPGFLPGIFHIVERTSGMSRNLYEMQDGVTVPYRLVHRRYLVGSVGLSLALFSGLWRALALSRDSLAAAEVATKIRNAAISLEGAREPITSVDARSTSPH